VRCSGVPLLSTTKRRDFDYDEGAISARVRRRPGTSNSLLLHSLVGVQQKEDNCGLGGE